MSDTLVDPVCGMPVEQQRAAATAEVDGRIYYFCSLTCSRQFQKEPARFTRSEIGKIRQ